MSNVQIQQITLMENWDTKFLSKFLYPNLPRPVWGGIFNFHKIYFPSHSHLSPIHYIASHSPSSLSRSDQEEHESVLTFFRSLWWQCYVEIGPWILMMMMMMMMRMMISYYFTLAEILCALCINWSKTEMASSCQFSSSMWDIIACWKHFYLQKILLEIFNCHVN